MTEGLYVKSNPSVFAYAKPAPWRFQRESPIWKPFSVEASPVQGEVARRSRDGGAVCKKTIPQSSHTRSQLPLHKGAFLVRQYPDITISDIRALLFGRCFRYLFFLLIVSIPSAPPDTSNTALHSARLLPPPVCGLSVPLSPELVGCDGSVGS